MSIYDVNPIGLDRVRTYPLASRQSKVTIADFARTINEKSSVAEYLSSLPNILAVQSLRELATQIRRASQLRKPTVWGTGRHVLKTGLAPLPIASMQRVLLSETASNG